MSECLKAIAEYCQQHQCDDECDFWCGSCLFMSDEVVFPPESWEYDNFGCRALKWGSDNDET